MPPRRGFILLTLCVNNCFIIALCHLSPQQPILNTDTQTRSQIQKHLLRTNKQLLSMSSVLSHSSSVQSTKNNDDNFHKVQSDRHRDYDEVIASELSNIALIEGDKEENHTPEIVPASCINTGNNLLNKYSGVWNVWYCQRHCRENSDCQYMTFYSNLSSPRLNHACYLFTECRLRNEDCRGCLAGSNNKDVVLDQCRVPPLRGGTWACTHNVTAEGKVWDSTTCVFICAGVSTAITCHHGNWDREIASINCPCKPLGGMDSLDCWPGMVGGVVEGGTVCTKTCGVEEFRANCTDGHWSRDLSTVECVDGWMALLTALLVLVAVAVAACLCVAFLLGYDRRHLEPRESHV